MEQALVHEAVVGENPFGATPDARVVPSPRSAVDWANGLPSDVQAYILSCCETTQDFVRLASVSCAWRHAATRSQRYQQVKALETAFVAEPTSMAERLDVARKRLRERGRKAKCQQKQGAYVFMVLVLLYSLGNVVAGALGLWIFGVARVELCDAPLQEAGVALAAMWLILGLGLVAIYMAQLFKSNAARNSLSALGLLLVTVGQLGSFGAMPAVWVFSSGSCSIIAPSFYAQAHAYVIAATVFVCLHCCCLSCTINSIR